jgi:glycosyltransferase involved in cell wall biosynthesis
LTSPTPILFAHSSNELYGSDVVLLELVRRLDAARYRPLVVTPTDIAYEGLLGQALAEAGIPHAEMDMPVLRRRYLSPGGIGAFLHRLRAGTRQVQRYLEEEHIALVHSNTSAVWGGALAARRNQIPHLWHVHEIVKQPVVVKKLMTGMIARYSDHVVAISNAVAEHLLAEQPRLAQRLSVIYDAVDSERFRPDIDAGALRSEWGITKNEILVGVVGRISAWKGQQFFLQALARALPKAPLLRAVIVGEAPPGEAWRSEALKARAQELGIGNKIIWAGYRNDTPQVMAALDILVLPSTQPEPFGMVVLEAMATGKPVIATAHGGPQETISDGETGYLVSPTDPAGMASALQALAQNPHLRLQLGEQARQHVIRKFTFDQHINAFSRLYEGLISPEK